MTIPEKCYSLLLSSINPKTKIGKIISIERGETGYRKTALDGDQARVDRLNEYLGINERVVAEAMRLASMFGWDKYERILKSLRKHGVCPNDLA